MESDNFTIFQLDQTTSGVLDNCGNADKVRHVQRRAPETVKPQVTMS